MRGTAEIVAGVTSEVLRFDVVVVDGDPASVVPSGSYLGPTLHLRQGQRGYFTYHCHILEHEDAGMMRNFLVS